MSSSDHFEILMAGDGYERIRTKKYTSFNKKPVIYFVCGLLGACLLFAVFSPQSTVI